VKTQLYDALIAAHWNPEGLVVRPVVTDSVCEAFWPLSRATYHIYVELVDDPDDEAPYYRFSCNIRPHTDRYGTYHVYNDPQRTLVSGCRVMRKKLQRLRSKWVELPDLLLPEPEPTPAPDTTAAPNLPTKEC
jgi:hypothetical protein